MPRIAYDTINYTEPTRTSIRQANRIIEEYRSQGFSLTLRQLYYQMVARGLIDNSQRSYKRIGRIVSNARMTGHIDWLAIVDRTRGVKQNSHWSSPEEIVETAAEDYQINKWKTQPYYPEVWIEKDALVGVISQVCRRLDVPYLSCRGYTSASEMWQAGYERLRRARQKPIIFHLADHDPSGIDMTRDIRERLALFAGRPVRVDRLALTFDQIEQYDPPPNWAKVSDSRYDSYFATYGPHSWELDALEPNVLNNLIEEAVISVRDEALWAEAVAQEQRHRVLLHETIDALSS
jgi:hypothetical protein